MTARIRALRSWVAELKSHPSTLRASRSWKVTQLFRRITALPTRAWKWIRWRLVRATCTVYLRAPLSARFKLRLVRAACIVYLRAPLPARLKLKLDDRISTACVSLLDSNQDDCATEVIETLKLHRGRRRSFLAVEGIAYLRASRTREARAHWSDYWKSALVDDGFANEADLSVPLGRVANHGFPITRRNDDFRYGVIGPSFCVYTALFGEYDSLPTPLYRPPGIDFICFSDRPRAVSGWDVRIIEPGMNHPSLKNRRLKILPHEYLSAYEYSLYVDANTLFLGDPVLLYHHGLQGKRFVAWRHPNRSDIYKECEAILVGLKHEPEPIVAEYDYFRNEGVPRDTGMLEASFLWRSHRDPEVRELLERWWAHVVRFGGRDQPGLAYWTWKSDTRPEVMPEHLGTVRANDFVARRPHDMTMIQVEQARSTRSGPPDVEESSPFLVETLRDS